MEGVRNDDEVTPNREPASQHGRAFGHPPGRARRHVPAGRFAKRGHGCQMPTVLPTALPRAQAADTSARRGARRWQPPPRNHTARVFTLPGNPVLGANGALLRPGRTGLPRSGRLRRKCRDGYVRTCHQRDSARLRRRHGNGRSDPRAYTKPGSRDRRRDGLLASKARSSPRSAGCAANEAEGCGSSMSCPTAGGGTRQDGGKAVYAVLAKQASA